MKKILILSLLAFSFFASDAQTKKSKSKKAKRSSVSTAAARQARLNALQAQRQLQIDSTVAYQVRYDSMRRETERMYDEKFQQDQATWKENKYREVDSMNHEHWVALSNEHEAWLKIQNQRNKVNQAVNLTANQDRQVSYINQAIFEKANMLSTDSTLNDNDRKQKLVQLNEERRNRIKAIVGKSKERKLEKARKANMNPADKEALWLMEVDGMVKR